MRSRGALTAVSTVLAPLAAACSAAPPPPPAAAQRTSCAEVLSLSLPPGFTCTPHQTTELTTALVDGPHVRVQLMAAPHLEPGDSSTDRPLRQGERLHRLSFNGPSA